MLHQEYVIEQKTDILHSRVLRQCPAIERYLRVFSGFRVLVPEGSQQDTPLPPSLPVRFAQRNCLASPFPDF